MEFESSIRVTLLSRFVLRHRRVCHTCYIIQFVVMTTRATSASSAISVDRGCATKHIQHLPRSLGRSDWHGPFISVFSNIYCTFDSSYWSTVTAERRSCPVVRWKLVCLIARFETLVHSDTVHVAGGIRECHKLTMNFRFNYFPTVFSALSPERIHLGTF